MKLIKNDEFVADLKNCGQIAAIKSVIKALNGKADNTCFHFETIHGHIVEVRLAPRYAKIEHIGNVIDRQTLARLEQNPWIRYLRFCIYANAIAVGLRYSKGGF